MPDATAISKNMILTQAVHLKDPPAINYPIKKTGYYCVGTYAYTGDDYEVIVEFRNAYGELPAAQIAKLPFYGGLAIVYAVVGAYVKFIQFTGYSTDILLACGHSCTCSIGMISVSAV